MALNIDDVLPSGIFWQNDPNVNQQLRQRIALQMMMQKKAYPKNVGEGLSAIGESLGDIGTARMLERQDAAAQAAGKAAAGRVQGIDGETGDTTGQKTSYAPAGGVADQSAVSAIDKAVGTPEMRSPTGGSLAGLPAEEGGYNPIDAAADTDPWPARRQAIGGIESGGAKDPYTSLGTPTRTGDRAYGKYQIMGANIPEWTKTATGTALTPQQFLANPAAQEGTFENRFGNYVDKYGEGGAARAWYGGEGGMNRLGATDLHGRLTVGGYGQDYLNRLNTARDRIAAAQVQQRAGVPQPNPTLSGAEQLPSEPPSVSGQPLGGDQRLALAALPPERPGITSDIRPAPPVPSQIRPMPQQVAQAVPSEGHIMAMPQAPPPPLQVPMSPLERRAINEINAAPNNPYIAQAVAPILAEEKAKREYEQNRRLEQYKIDLGTHKELVVKREEQIATAAKRILDAQKLRQEIEQGKTPKTEDIEGKMQFDPVNKVWIRPPTGGPPPDPNTPPTVKMSAEQAKSQKFHGWTSLAEEQMQGKEGILANGLQQELAGKIPFVGNKAQQAEYRRVRAASERFVQGFLRDISGAVISPEELAKHQATFLPRYGDDPRTIADKKAAREQIISGLYAGAGPGRAISDWEKRQRTEKQIVQDAKINEEMQGKEKIVGKPYRKGDAVRKWNGTRWEEF